MGKYFFLIVLGFLFNACSLSNNFNEKLELIINNDKKNTFDSCANFSYISNINDKNYGVLFSEYINLDSSCYWNGLQRGYFEYLFKTTLKIKSFKIIERKDFYNYEFTTYLIDDKYYMNLIYKYSTYEDMFIIDYDGKYFTKLIKEFDKNYENMYLNKERFSSNYSNSLVKMNFINAYFSKQKEEIFEK
ncbi:MAG: hypothetical protein U5K55_07440 [Aliarcobacter sp.]|nr:hypothetical protein [Aliarcobacter sp.]